VAGENSVLGHAQGQRVGQAARHVRVCTRMHTQKNARTPTSTRGLGDASTTGSHAAVFLQSLLVHGELDGISSSPADTHTYTAAAAAAAAQARQARKEKAVN